MKVAWYNGKKRQSGIRGMGSGARGKSRKAASRANSRDAGKNRDQVRAASARRRKNGTSGPGAVRRLFNWIARLMWFVAWRVAMVLAVIIAASVAYTYTTLPEIDDLLDGRSRGSVTLLDKNDEVFAWRGDHFGGVVSAGSVSGHLVNAVLATEDKRFYSHFGLSARGIAGAVWINVREGRGPLTGHGGSTITQQTAKLLCLGVEYSHDQWESEAEYIRDCRRGSMSRKIMEAVYALAMEYKYTKDEILSIYLNRAYMGSGAYGVEAAAQRYFGKTAAFLNPQESAMLAGLLTAPTRLSPTTNLQRSQDRAATVLRLMNEQGHLDYERTVLAQDNPAVLSEAAEARSGGYFADWVMDSGPEYFTRETVEDVIIRTTLDNRIQRAAEEALTHVFDTKVREGSLAQAAVVVMSPNGAVRAMVGGRKSQVSGAFNRATMARRQTGSAFKPFVYAAGLDFGYGANDKVKDEPYCLEVRGSGRWCPENYKKEYHGRVSLVSALSESLNVPAVKVSESVGREAVAKVAEDFGIEGELANGPALALGVSDSTLLEMTGAYAGFLNGGISVAPIGLISLRLARDDVSLMKAEESGGKRAISEKTARELVWMMHEVIETGTGARAKLPDREAAGKTGTTQAARDAWFIGFTGNYVAGVWMGYDDNTPLTGVTGGGLPADIWRETMIRVHEGIPPKPLPMARPAGMASKSVKLEKEGGNVIESIIKSLLGGNR